MGFPFSISSRFHHFLTKNFMNIKEILPKVFSWRFFVFWFSFFRISTLCIYLFSRLQRSLQSEKRTPMFARQSRVLREIFSFFSTKRKKILTRFNKIMWKKRLYFPKIIIHQKILKILQIINKNPLSGILFKIYVAHQQTKHPTSKFQPKKVAMYYCFSQLQLSLLEAVFVQFFQRIFWMISQFFWLLIFLKIFL